MATSITSMPVNFNRHARAGRTVFKPLLWLIHDNPNELVFQILAKGFDFFEGPTQRLVPPGLVFSGLGRLEGHRYQVQIQGLMLRGNLHPLWLM